MEGLRWLTLSQRTKINLHLKNCKRQCASFSVLFMGLETFFKYPWVVWSVSRGHFKFIHNSKAERAIVRYFCYVVSYLRSVVDEKQEKYFMCLIASYVWFSSSTQPAWTLLALVPNARCALVFGKSSPGYVKSAFSNDFTVFSSSPSSGTIWPADYFWTLRLEVLLGVQRLKHTIELSNTILRRIAVSWGW